MLTPRDFIKVVRDSFTGSDIVYREGACWQFYKILKTVFPDARPWYDRIDGHIYTEIDNRLYDILGDHGEMDNRANLEPVPNPDLSLTEVESWGYQLKE